MSQERPIRLLACAWLCLSSACNRPATPAANESTTPAASSSAMQAPSATLTVAPAPARRRIVTVKTSLEPGGASEVVEIEERAEGARLRVRRIHSDDRVESASVGIEAKVVDELWAGIRASGLESAEAPEADARIVDGTSYMLLLEWPDRQTRRLRVHSLHWTQPKSQPEAFTQLFQRVGELARSKASKVKLRYYGS